MKFCNDCQHSYTDENFYPVSSHLDELDSYCKPCRRKRSVKIYHKNPDKDHARKKEQYWRKKADPVWWAHYQERGKIKNQRRKLRKQQQDGLI